jgi:predicted acylesterase/phospholipase RssA
MIKKLVLTLLASVSADEIFEQPEAAAKCHALAFSSGDEDAAYQAGVLKGITTNPKLSPSDYAYDSVSGVSGGALNAVLLSSFEKGQEQQAAERMEEFWKAATHSQLYKNWFGGIARGLFFEGGLYNSAPMEDFLKSQFKSVQMHRALDIGIVDVINGDYKDFSDLNITHGDNLIDALYASMSFAGFFPPAEVLGSAYFDGSAVWDIDIFSAINRCSDKGFKNEDIVVDVVLTSSANLKQVEAEDYKSIGMLFRYLEISSFYNSMDGLLRAQFAYKGVNFRYVISPSGSIPSSMYPLNLKEKDIDKAFTMGVADANKAI